MMYKITKFKRLLKNEVYQLYLDKDLGFKVLLGDIKFDGVLLNEGILTVGIHNLEVQDDSILYLYEV